MKYAAPFIKDLFRIKDSTKKGIIEESHKIEEEDRDRGISTFMRRNTQRRDLEQEVKEDTEDSDRGIENIVMDSPALNEKPFLYFGFGINLYFDFLLLLILTMAMV